MPPTNLIPLKRAWPCVAAALATCLALSPAHGASAAGQSPSPTAVQQEGHVSDAKAPGQAPIRSIPTKLAAQAGVQEGDASMGWREHTPARLAAQQAEGAQTAAARSGVSGMDVSGWQRTVNWAYWKRHGKSFAYVKATEGRTFRNPYFSAQYRGSARVGMLRGAYHFGLPNRSSGAVQARFFVGHGGGWSRDGRTLPGVLDVEYNPYGPSCYGLTKKNMVSWIKSFTRQYKALTGRDTVIYTTNGWWTRCTGNSHAFHRTNPLWVARYARSVGKLPGGWTFYTFWQHTPSPLDQNRFSSRRSRLVVLAKG